MFDLSPERIYEIEVAAEEMNLLEAGGVDNWQGYSESLYPQDDRDNDISHISQKLRGQREQYKMLIQDTLDKLKAASLNARTGPIYSEDNPDKENAHKDADKALLEFLQALGFSSIVEAYAKVKADVGGFWHA